MNRSIPSRVDIQFEHELLAILGLSFLLIVLIYLIPISALRIMLGIPYVLFFPGYTFVVALFPGKDDLEGIERLGLSLGLSIAVLPLMGLVLNYTPFGITLLTTLFSATCFMAGSTAVAYYRRGRLPPENRFVLGLQLDLKEWRSSGLIDRSLTVALGFSIVLAVGTFLFVLAKPEVGERFTEFYIVGLTGRAEGYPTEVTVGEPFMLIVGVINREHEDVQYRIVREVGGHAEQQVTGIDLTHDEKWEKRLTFAFQNPGESQRMAFLLYREDQEEPYRSLHLWIDVVAIATVQPVETPRAPAAPTPAPSPTAQASPTAEPAVAATPTPPPTPMPTEAPIATAPAQVIHVVQPGETLSSIGRLYGVTYQAIMEANGLEDPNLLESGQELVIPPAE